MVVVAVVVMVVAAVVWWEYHLGKNRIIDIIDH